MPGLSSFRPKRCHAMPSTPAGGMATPFSSSGESEGEGCRHPRPAKGSAGPDTGARGRNEAGPPGVAGGAQSSAGGQALTARSDSPLSPPGTLHQAGAVSPEVAELARSGVEGQTGIVPAQMSQQWPDLLHEAMVALGVFREQARPLLMVTAFTGLGSQRRVWQATGLSCRELASADPKPYAKVFLAAHGLFGEHHFDGIRMLTSGGSAACARCHRVCEVPTERPDFFAGGFPCQPSSRARRTKKRIRAEEHPLFPTVRAAVEYLRARQPRVALLEQTMGALEDDES